MTLLYTSNVKVNVNWNNQGPLGKLFRFRKQSEFSFKNIKLINWRHCSGNRDDIIAKDL